MLRFLPKRKRTYSSVDIAKYFLEHISGTKEKLHLLVYVAHGIRLAYFNLRLLTPKEQPSTSSWGICLKSLDDAYNESGHLGRKKFFLPFDVPSLLLLDYVIKKFDRLSGEELLSRFCNEDSPLSETLTQKGYGQDICDSLIKKQFNDMLSGRSDIL